MNLFELAALAAGLVWAFGSILSPRPAAHLGTISFNRIRLSMMAVLLALWAALGGGWQSLGAGGVGVVLSSGLVGIFLGDTALFAAMNRIGPRRTGMLFALNAPIAAVLGAWVLGERVDVLALFGIVLVTAGVGLAIAYRRSGAVHEWEAVKGSLVVGVGFGVLAATGQALGALIVAPVLTQGADPIAVAALRVASAALCLNLISTWPLAAFRAAKPPNPRILAQTFLSGFLGMGLGMGLLMYALSGAEVGIVATLSSTTPVLLLPLLWATTGERPHALAWLGALVSVVGTGLIFA